MNGKFSSIRARVLYERADADLTVGDSSDGVGWAGLYLNFERPGGYILHEDTQGFVTLYSFVTDEEIQERWQIFADNLEISGNPEDNDYVISPQPDGSWNVNLLGESFFDWASTIEAIRADIPEGTIRQVWVISENDNFLPVDV